MFEDVDEGIVDAIGVLDEDEDPDEEVRADSPGIGYYAGGQVCPSCDERVGIVDSYCRYCGWRLRDPERQLESDGGQIVGSSDEDVRDAVLELEGGESGAK